MTSNRLAPRFLIPLVYLATLLFTRTAPAADPDSFSLDPKGSSLKFIGESFLHNFEGEAKSISGSAVVDAQATPPIQKATLHFKTSSLTTANKDRDQKMFDWLKVKDNPEILFQLQSVKVVGGDYKTADARHPALFKVNGTLTLHGVKQPIGGTANGWREKNRVIVKGDAVVDTLKFGLPQIRMGLLTVGTEVKTTYVFSFEIPQEYAK